MAHRDSARARANTAQRRARIEYAARFVVADGGFAAASINAVARAAACSPRHITSFFDSRDELLRTVFANAAGHELEVVTEAVDACGTPDEVVGAVVEVFIRRSVAGRGLAYALLIEDVPDSVQRERRALRRGYVTVIAAALKRTLGLDYPAEVFARSLVGAIAENLVDLLDPARSNPSALEVEWHISTIATYARAALTALPRDNAPIAVAPAAG
ncbi:MULTISPECIES: TetR family transcriptional regulator [Brevibacterium]|uniref:TetR/AcrR family transcriptional regulator n=2 Tax=Brevibacterium TaxID=1696 RepID=A0ABP9U2L1_9MICO